jgi:hypothetical protein
MSKAKCFMLGEKKHHILYGAFLRVTSIEIIFFMHNVSS